MNRLLPTGICTLFNALPLQTYGFRPASSTDLTGIGASKHFAIYMFQNLIRGLLRHQVDAQLQASICWT